MRPDKSNGQSKLSEHLGVPQQSRFPRSLWFDYCINWSPRYVHKRNIRCFVPAIAGHKNCLLELIGYRGVFVCVVNVWVSWIFSIYLKFVSDYEKMNSHIIVTLPDIHTIDHTSA
jgi:hypothetical protein